MNTKEEPAMDAFMPVLIGITATFGLTAIGLACFVLRPMASPPVQGK